MLIVKKDKRSTKSKVIKKDQNRCLPEGNFSFENEYHKLMNLMNKLKQENTD